MNKLIYSFFLGLALLTAVGRAYADDDEIPPPPVTEPATTAPVDNRFLGPLETQAFGTGAVSIGDAQGLVLIVLPVVSTEGGIDHYFVSGDAEGRYDGFTEITDKVKVGIKTSMDVQKTEIHIHTVMTALSPVTVIAARVNLAFPYADWSETDYRFSKSNGKIPWKKTSNVLIATGALDGLSLGPAIHHGDLKVQFAGSGLTAILQDNRQWEWYSNLSVILSHGESLDKPWIWKAGETKDFDFNLSFNRDFATLPTEQPKASQELTGYWYGRVDGLDGRERICLGIKKLKMKYLAYFHDLDQFGNGMNDWFNVTRKGRTFLLENGLVQASVTLNEAGDSLTGQGQWNEAGHPLSFKRGLDYLLPRVDADGGAVTEYSYQLPQTLADGWPVGNLLESALDPQVVARGIDEILNGRLSNIEGLSVVKNGKLILDEYFMGEEPGDTHQLQSASKSVLSILFGIAQDHGWVNVNNKLFDYFPEYRAKDWTDQKDKILLKHLLSMTFGINDGWTSDYMGEMLGTSDWLDFVFSLPSKYRPGEHWGYCTSCMEPLGAIIARKSGMSIPAFAQKYLFDPLGIQEHSWGKSGPHQVTEVGGSLWLKPRDMAKLGQLFFQKGKWNGQQVVSEKWVEESTKPQATTQGGGDYGYLWWEEQMPFKGGKTKVFYASGRGGQFIFVVPELDLVCAITAGNYTPGAEGNPPYDFFKAYILGAFK